AFACSASLRSPRERNHAVCARFVAAFNDGDVRTVRIVAPREWGLEGLVGIETQARNAPVAGLEPHQHLRQFGVTGRACNQAHVRRFVENLLAFLLRHASEYTKDLAFARLPLEVLQTVEHLLL